MVQTIKSGKKQEPGVKKQDTVMKEKMKKPPPLKTRSTKEPGRGNASAAYVSRQIYQLSSGYSVISGR
jgi:hypothetical protein